MSTAKQYQTTFYDSVRIWTAARLGLKFWFLGALAEQLRKATIGFLISVLSVCLSLRRTEQGDFHCTYFRDVSYLIFLKPFRYI